MGIRCPMHCLFKCESSESSCLSRPRLFWSFVFTAVNTCLQHRLSRCSCLIMKNTRILNLALCACGAVAIIIGLQWFSLWRQHHLNGFLRKQPTHKLDGAGLVKLADDFHYIAGISGSCVYLASKVDRGRLLVLTPGRKDSSFLMIKPSVVVRFSVDAKLQIIDSNYYIFDGTRGQVVKGRLHSGAQTSRLQSKM